MKGSIFGFFFLQGIVASPFDKARNAQRALSQDIKAKTVLQEGIRHLQLAEPVDGEAEAILICDAWGTNNEMMFPFVMGCMTSLGAFLMGADMEVDALQEFCDDSKDDSCVGQLNNLISTAEEDGSDNCKAQASDMNSMRTVCLREGDTYCFSQLTELTKMEEGGVPSSDVVCHPCYMSMMDFAAGSTEGVDGANVDDLSQIFSSACIEDGNGNNCIDLIMSKMTEQENSTDVTGCLAEEEDNFSGTCSESCTAYLNELISSLGCCAEPLLEMEYETALVTTSCGITIPPICGTPQVEETPAEETSTPEVSTNGDSEPTADGDSETNVANETDSSEETSDGTDETDPVESDETSYATSPTISKIYYTAIATVAVWLTGSAMM